MDINAHSKRKTHENTLRVLINYDPVRPHLGLAATQPWSGQGGAQMENSPASWGSYILGRGPVSLGGMSGLSSKPSVLGGKRLNSPDPHPHPHPQGN